MNSDEAIEIAHKFLKAERRLVKECMGAFLPSELEAKDLPAEAKETWVVKFLVNRPKEFEGMCPGHVIVLVNDKTEEARFGVAL